MAGVYAVIAYTVGQRSNEIGLRMALGASTSSVLRLVLGQGLMYVGIGFALGLAAAIVITRLLNTILFQVRPSDPEVYLAVAALLGAVAFLASYVPARRATKIDPLTRYERNRSGGPGMNRRKRMMEDLDEDIRDHIERETQDNIERGMSPEEARYAALRKFGNVTRVKEDTWEVWTFALA